MAADGSLSIRYFFQAGLTNTVLSTSTGPAHPPANSIYLAGIHPSSPGWPLLLVSPLAVLPSGLLHSSVFLFLRSRSPFLVIRFSASIRSFFVGSLGALHFCSLSFRSCARTLPPHKRQFRIILTQSTHRLLRPTTSFSLVHTGRRTVRFVARRPHRPQAYCLALSDCVSTAVSRHRSFDHFSPEKRPPYFEPMDQVPNEDPKST